MSQYHPPDYIDNISDERTLKNCDMGAVQGHLSGAVDAADGNEE